jgi:hypothetical protein
MEQYDEVHSTEAEERHNIIGIVNKVVVIFLVATEQGDRIRIIHVATLIVRCRGASFLQIGELALFVFMQFFLDFFFYLFCKFQKILCLFH